MMIKASEVAGFEDEKIAYKFFDSEEAIEIHYDGVFERIDLSCITQKMIDIEYDEDLFNELMPIRSAERDGAGELLVEVLWAYKGIDDKLDFLDSYEGSGEFWRRLYQRQ